MLARTILATLVSAACFATVNAQTCSATNPVCCQQLQDPDNLNADALNLLRLLNINPNTLTGAVGLTCTSLVSGSCNANAACCTGNNYYLCPQENTVIIQPEDEITHAGTASTGTKTMKPARGIVLAVGTPKALGKGGRHAMDVRLGDLVIYTKGKGKEVKVDNDEYLLLDRDEILAVAD
ncbi:hypothetical protein CNMCM8714_007853 [Aspergillus fumigatus]|nr:hypothetical protein CNMCM8714_007853 [Aspergillus fumigatus]